MLNESKKYCVYKHLFPNGKVYIGITCQEPLLRWRSDGSGYRPHKKDSNLKIWNAIQKYGWNNIEHIIILKGLEKEDAIEKEIALIKHYNSTDDRYGYNTSIGGECITFTPEIRKKISDARKGNNYGYVGENAPMYGKHHSEISKAKISKATKGKNNPMYGVHPTENEKQRQRELHRDISKMVIQRDKNGVVVAKYQSIHFASKVTGINRQGISFCIHGKQKTAGGYFWEEVEKEK